MFRTLLDEFQDALSKCTSKEEAIRLITKHKENIELGVRAISRPLSESRIRSIVGTIRTIFSSKSPAWLALFAGIGAAVPTAVTGNIGGAIASASLGAVAGAAIELAHYRKEKLDKKEPLEISSPYSYLYFAEKEGLIKRNNE